MWHCTTEKGDISLNETILFKGVLNYFIRLLCITKSEQETRMYCLFAMKSDKQKGNKHNFSPRCPLVLIFAALTAHGLN